MAGEPPNWLLTDLYHNVGLPKGAYFLHAARIYKQPVVYGGGVRGCMVQSIPGQAVRDVRD